MLTPSQRIDKILVYKGITINRLASLLEIERAQGLYDIQKGKTKGISLNITNKILSVIPEINRSWLLTGEGEMLKAEEESIDAARAFYLQSHMVNDYISKLGISENQIKVASLLIPHLIQRDSYFFAFDVIDDRLSNGIEPALHINDIVIAELSSSREIPFFMALVSNPVIVVVLSDKYGQLVRKVADVRNDEIVLAPTNTIHIHDKEEHIIIKIKEIKMLGIVKKIIVNDPVFKID